jgi:hypothetical protein
MNKLIMLTAGALYLSACASTSPNLDSRHGDAVRAATARQMLNPMASSNTDPVKGMDGKAAVGRPPHRVLSLSAWLAEVSKSTYHNDDYPNAIVYHLEE